MRERWQGTYTAMLTPFRADGSLDETGLARLADFQIDSGVEGLVPCGIKAERLTLSSGEQLRAVEIVLSRSDGRTSVLAVAAGSLIEEVIQNGRRAEALGVEGLLVSPPEDHLPDQDGLYGYFSRLADSVQIPLIVHGPGGGTVRGRTAGTGSDLLPETVLRLASHGNIVGIQEGWQSLVPVIEILAGRPEGFRVLSGEDRLTLPILALGGDGVISVVSNEVPVLMSRMVREALCGRIAEARALHYRLLGLMQASFIEANPSPVRAALAMMGLVEEHGRLPLVPLASESRELLRKHLVRLELIEE